MTEHVALNWIADKKRFEQKRIVPSDVINECPLIEYKILQTDTINNPTKRTLFVKMACCT
jgi:hypothetical protein